MDRPGSLTRGLLCLSRVGPRLALAESIFFERQLKYYYTADVYTSHLVGSICPILRFLASLFFLS